MACNYRYKNRQYHCLSGGYIARSAKPRKQKSSRQSSRSAPPLLRWRVVPCAGGTDNEAGLFFPDFASAADYCMEKDIPYLFEEDATGNYETTVWIVGEPDGNVTMLPMSWKNFLSVCTIHPFICPQCGTSHPPPA
ncbi:transposase [Escherichia coli]|uniref:transposase n=3 Tax=Enterobacteriaceae TaxID=543 RepID=UPI001A91E94E|nr:MULTISPECIES: transposase [Escherichia]MCN2229305.1 transposase [Escherichia coli]MEC9604920.1 transposase [Escherichia marmotae]MED0235708.1 transposase [Escherichia marmotae]MED0539168.1 transposase [Escherichia marmotae]MED8761576.1 transposase [Escherichia marmotae]